ncbi:MAG: hypothetical protein ABIJ72_02955, partial [bacterium]
MVNGRDYPDFWYSCFYIRPVRIRMASIYHETFFYYSWDLFYFRWYRFVSVEDRTISNIGVERDWIKPARSALVFPSPSRRALDRKVFTGLLLRAAWHSLRELLGDSRWLGALPGAIGVFQSW